MEAQERERRGKTRRKERTTTTRTGTNEALESKGRSNGEVM